MAETPEVRSGLLRAVFETPEYRQAERDAELWRLRAEFIDAAARSDVEAIRSRTLRFGGPAAPAARAAERLVTALDETEGQ